MSPITDDPNDPRLGHGVGGEGMNEAYLVLSDEERAKGFVRPYRDHYVHVGPPPGREGALTGRGCGVETRMNRAIAETYARQPHFYGATFCVGCNTHLPVGEHGEFVWDDGTRVGT